MTTSETKQEIKFKVTRDYYKNGTQYIEALKLEFAKYLITIMERGNVTDKIIKLKKSLASFITWKYLSNDDFIIFDIYKLSNPKDSWQYVIIGGIQEV